MRRTLLCAVTALATLAALVLSAGPASAGQFNSVWMESPTTGWCVSGAGVTPTHEPCLDVGTQLWTFDGPLISSHHRIVNTGTGLCVTAVGSSSVQMQTCGSARTQLWRLTGSGNTFRIANVSTGKCLSQTSLHPGTPLQQGLCSQQNVWLLLY